MGKVVFDVTMSLDGFTTGPHDDVEHPLGIDGERLHQWLFDLSTWREHVGLSGGETNQDAEVAADYFETTGTFVMGKRMFEVGLKPWGDNPPFHLPVYVVTHHAQAPLVKAGGTTFFFVTEGVERALQQAQASAGDKDVSIAGGANIAQQLLRAGRADEMQIHVVPILMGGGRRLFDGGGLEHLKLERIRVVDSPTVTHLKFRILK
jgi:dihydrofolate reductase